VNDLRKREFGGREDLGEEHETEEEERVSYREIWPPSYAAAAAGEVGAKP
jgi:hypothetical protein